ncbi:stage II sporulation protein P [Cytobacillus praedii]|uniref:stage II sporulation protein P n=1 Tax=Cytobacillus praedii TaxID=1742358 RepID=UPI0007098A23|nr:stage II sporulation protein P [Cytobacillus praedii]
MQTDKELLNLIKESHEMNPKSDFVSNTELHLRKTAKQMNKKSRYKWRITLESGFLVCSVLLFFSLSGREFIYYSLSPFGESNSVSPVGSQEPLIYIYHSHDQESFISETQSSDPNIAYHPSKNISLVGERFSQSLKKYKINTKYENRDIMSTLMKNGWSHSKTYTVTRGFLTDVLENNKSIKMVFDIHRDSKKREATTIKIDGKDYATVTFVISKSNANYEKNLTFAESLLERIEEKYPDLSTGVIVKTSLRNQSTYNQDLINESVLLNIGGVENTLEEEYRTVDALAEVINEILREKN